MLRRAPPILFYFFFNDTATTEIYTLSLHDALPISLPWQLVAAQEPGPMYLLGSFCAGSAAGIVSNDAHRITLDRKSTRLNSSHGYISYAVFCLKKKKQTISIIIING